MKKSGKLWGGRFEKPTDSTVERFTESISFDRRLFKWDIMGSIAHAEMLARQGIITNADAKAITKGLREIESEIEEGRFKFLPEHEDIHMNIEAALIERTGEPGMKLHTGRSRNDQIALDMRLYIRAETRKAMELLGGLMTSLIKQAEVNLRLIMPGYTHMQHAQPVLLSHHLMAYFEMFMRDYQRFEDSLERIEVMPLGSGAIAGSGLDLDRLHVARKLGFKAITSNSMDAVSDRDFVIEYCANASTVMMHLSRMSEEIVIWSSTEFGFVRLDDSFTTGSSMMPQKRNPDVAELVRGKTGRVYGSLVSVLTMMKGLPLTYNRDLQEDKEAVFDAADTLNACIEVTSKMLGSININVEKLGKGLANSFIYATDLADHLVGKGVPFRSAHEIVGKLVKECETKGIGLNDMRVEDLKNISDKFDSSALKLLKGEASAGTKVIPGGTAPSQVKSAIKLGRARLKNLK